MQQVTINYCGMEGTGTSVTKAKQDATQRIERVLSGQWDPYLLVHKDWCAIVVRQPSPQPEQWGYKVIQQGEQSQNLWVSPSWNTRDGAINKAAYHLAQCVGDYQGLEPHLSINERSDLDHYFEWQADYAAAKSKGLDDTACREYANRRK